MGTRERGTQNVLWSLRDSQADGHRELQEQELQFVRVNHRAVLPVLRVLDFDLSMSSDAYGMRGKAKS